MLNEADKKTILDLHQHGKGTIQDYARIYRVPVSEILELLGEGHLSSVSIGGDLVDEAELGPTGRGQVNGPEQIDVPYTTH